MNWESVDSSQISEVGYDAASKTLGIRFKSGARISEYHYANVPPMVHRTMITAESVSSYFAAEIKKRPDLYPYTKVEADPTPASTPARIVDAETRASTQSNGAESTIDSPSTTLTVIDTMADDLLFTPGYVTDAMILAGREYYLTEAKKYDVTTEKNRTALKRFARPLQKLRTGIEARAKELTGATKRKIAAIDAEKRRLVMLVGGIEQEVLAPLTAYEAAENARIEARNAVIEGIKAAGEFAQANWMNLEAEAMRGKLNEIESATLNYPELGELVERTRAEAIKLIGDAITKRATYDTEQAELAKLRAEAAARDQQARIDFAAKEAKEQAEKQAAFQAEIDKRKIEEAEERARQAELTAKRDAEQAIENERMRVAVEAKREREASEARAADEAHRNKVNYESASALVSECHIDGPAAHEVIRAIAKGLIPHVSILY